MKLIFVYSLADFLFYSACVYMYIHAISNLNGPFKITIKKKYFYRVEFIVNYSEVLCLIFEIKIGLFCALGFLTAKLVLYRIQRLFCHSYIPELPSNQVPNKIQTKITQKKTKTIPKSITKFHFNGYC